MLTSFLFKRKIKVKKKNPYPNHRYIRDLGKGGFAVVKLYKHKNNLIAIKSFHKNEEDSYSEFKFELAGLQGAGVHDHVVKFLNAFEDAVSYNVVLEYCERGVLAQIYKDFKEYTEEHVRDVVMQCSEGLKHLLSRKIIHRDIKPDNILVKRWDPIFVVLADLNFSKKIKSLKNRTILQTVLGTDGYMAPEIENTELRKDGKSYNFSIDVFALGIVAYELFTVKLRPVFDLPDERRNKAFEEAVGMGLTGPQILQKAKQEFHDEIAEQGVPLLPEDRWYNVSPEAKNIIVAMIMPVYHSRPSYEELLSSDWATKEYRQGELKPVMNSF